MISKYWKVFSILFLIILYLIYKIYLDYQLEPFLVGNCFISPNRVNSLDTQHHFERGGVNPLYDPYKDNIDKSLMDKSDRSSKNCCDPYKSSFQTLPKNITKLQDLKKYIKPNSNDSRNDIEIINSIIKKYQTKNINKDDYDSSKGCSNFDYIDGIIFDHLKSKHTTDGNSQNYDLNSNKILEYIRKYNKLYSNLANSKEQLFNKPIETESNGIERDQETCRYSKDKDKNKDDSQSNLFDDYNNQMAAVGKYGIYKGMSPSLPYCSQSNICKALKTGAAMSMAADKLDNNCGKCFKLTCIKNPNNWKGNTCNGRDVILKVVDKMDNTSNSDSSYPHLFNLDSQQYQILAGNSNSNGLLPIQYKPIKCPF